jgi:phage terminase large subunit-like protein
MEDDMPFDSTCQIRRALINGNGQAQIDLKADNGAFDWQWFVSSPAAANAVLSVGLTAIATNKKIVCTINDPVTAWAQVVNFGIAK